MGDEQVRSLAAAIGANVRGWRAGLGLRQPDLAEAMVNLGEETWSASTVSRVEDGQRAISVSELINLACALGATLEELLDPVGFGDESPVELPGGTIEALRLRTLVRGEVRVRITFDGSKKDFRVSKTDRGGSAAVLGFGLQGGEEILRRLKGKR